MGLSGKKKGQPSEKKESALSQSGTYFRLLLSPGYTTFDILLLAGGIIFAIGAGIPFPLLGILFGQLIDNLNTATCTEQSGGSTNQLEDSVRQKVLYIIYVTIANWCFIYLHSTCWSLFGERLVRRLREKYLRGLLRQEQAYFETLPGGDVSARLSIDLEAIQTGTSEKVGICIGSISYFAASYVVAFIKDTTLAGILVSLVPAFFLMAFGGAYFTKRYTGRVSDSIASATSIASESLNKLTIVHAFGAQARLEAKFAEYLGEARTHGFKKAITAAVQLGLLYFIAYSTNALAYWQGSKGIAESVGSDGASNQVGAVYTVIFLLIDASFIISQVAPFMQIFGTAAGASEKLNKTIARQSKIDSTDNSGRRLGSVAGNIEFKCVDFAYPARPDTQVLRDFSIHIPANMHTAIVGQSGSGKSTVAALMLRLYDPVSGHVQVDGVDIRELNVAHLRDIFGSVQQDPCLLDRSILENVAHGLVNYDGISEEERLVILNGAVAECAEQVRKGRSLENAMISGGPALKGVVDRVVKAAGIADAMGFIERLEHGIATSVGSAGHQLSGGQKQKIALSRALIRDPKVLLLDEATSALDSRSEKAIQGALDEAAKGRTTISIVHRLSTIKHANNIIVMGGGKVLEQGSPQELLASDGLYASMVRIQNVSQQGAVNVPDDVNDIDVEESSKTGSTSEHDLNEKSPSAASAEAPGDAVSVEDGSAEEKRSGKQKKECKRGVLSTISGIGTLTRSQALYLLVAFFASAVVGGSYSGEAVIFGHTIGSFSACNTPESIRYYGQFWGLLFFVLAIIEFFANLTMGSVFGIISENTLYKIRCLSFKTLLNQEVQWHESEGRTPSSLLSYITTESNALAGLTGVTLGMLFSIIINTVAGIALSHAIAWRIAVVLLACIPVLLGAGVMRLRVFAKFHEKHAAAFSSATGFAVEAVNSIRTIAVFSLEQEAVNVYHRALKAPYAATLKAILWSNVWLASAYSVATLVYALAYWWGTQNIIEGRYSQTEFFIVLPALLFSAQTCGQLFALAPDFSKSRVSAAKILDLLDIGKNSMSFTSKQLKGPPNAAAHVPEKDVEHGDWDTSVSTSRAGGAEVRFKDVRFSYPARSNVPVLQGLDLDIRPGQFCALVGPSGAGKSTIISLIERFYRPTSGSIMLDGRNLNDSISTNFRNDIALVPQDSVLFEGTLRFNLGLGARPGQTVSDADLEEACKLANIYESIMELPEKFDTKCGPNGNQFSGGQRQRLSIARSLIRKPRLLLLDESTSALDAEGERLVQEALERVRKGITVIAIAHRLYTIEKADRIFVIEDGRCVAQGTHQNLLRTNESYRTNALHQVVGGSQ